MHINSENTPTQLLPMSCHIGKDLLFSSSKIRLESGALTALLGSNGSGKTSFLQWLAGLETPGRQFSQPSPLIENKRSLYLGSTSGLFQELTIDEHFQLLGTMLDYSTSLSDTLAKAYQAFFDLHFYGKKKAVELSLGWQRRLSLALAFFHKPELLLLDEPLRGLDQEGIALLFLLLEQWKSTGRSVILALHRISGLEGYFDSFLEIQAGTLGLCPAPVSREKIAMEEKRHILISLGAL